MSQYQTPPDLLEYIRTLDARIQALERPPVAPYAFASTNGATVSTSGVEQAMSLPAWGRSWTVDVTGTRITVNNPGRYLITSNVGFATNGTGYRKIRAQVTRGATVFTVAESSTAALSGVPTHLSAAGAHDLEAGDYVELYCTQTSGGSLALLDESGGVSSENFRNLTVFRMA